MKYFVITKNNKNVAVVFHDYLTQYYLVRSKSEAFRRSFNASVQGVSYSFSKTNDSLVPSRIGLDSPLWSNQVLLKACEKFWQIGKVANSGSQTVEQIIDKYLS